MNRTRVLLAAIACALAFPSIAGADPALDAANSRALDAAMAYHLSEAQATDRARQAAPIATPALPDPTARKPIFAPIPPPAPR